MTYVTLGLLIVCALTAAYFIWAIHSRIRLSDSIHASMKSDIAKLIEDHATLRDCCKGQNEVYQSMVDCLTEFNSRMGRVEARTRVSRPQRTPRPLMEKEGQIEQHQNETDMKRVEETKKIKGLVFAGTTAAGDNVGSRHDAQCVGLEFVSEESNLISLVSYNRMPSEYNMHLCIEDVKRLDFAHLKFDIDMQDIGKTIRMDWPSTIRLISTTGDEVPIRFRVVPVHQSLSFLPHMGEITMAIMENLNIIAKFTMVCDPSGGLTIFGI